MKNQQISRDIANSQQQPKVYQLRGMGRPNPEYEKTTSLNPLRCAIAAAAMVGVFTASSTWATGPSPDTAGSTRQETMAQTDNPQVQEINSYVRTVEKNVSSYTRSEEKLSPGELKEVTDKEWSKIHAYTDGNQLKRLKVYPSDGSQRTEEFYYKNGNLVFAFLEENGLGKEPRRQRERGQVLLPGSEADCRHRC